MTTFDITPPCCGLYATPAEADACPQVVVVNTSASPAQLLGLVEGRCRELAMLAMLASASHAAEADLRQCLAHLWTGLDTVNKVLHHLTNRPGDAA
jgi:hypothetical protein